MTTLDLIAEKVKRLPPDKQQEVLDFAEFLGARQVTGRPLKSIGGIGEDLGASISGEEIDEARREMWSGFPREDV